MKTLRLTTGTMICGWLLLALSRPGLAQTVADIGLDTPVPGPTDITNFYAPDPAFGTDEKPGGMNYYDDNGNGLVSPGQTFLSLTNGVLTSVTLQMGNNAGTYGGGGGTGGTGPGLLRLRVYRLTGPGSTTATKLAEYHSDPNFQFTTEHWLQWSGIAVPVTNGVTYAYSISSGTYAGSGPGAGSQMYCRVYCIPGDHYPNGSICLIQASGGANSVTYNSTANTYDQNFDLGFSDYSVLQRPLAGTPSISPGASLYGGSPFTLTEEATGGNLHYQWQTDGGSGVFTNIPGATSSNLTQVAVDTGLSPIGYSVIVTNLNGAATSAVVQVTIAAPSAPLLDADLDTLAPTMYAGGSLTFSASFSGTLPIRYQWLTNSGAGEFPIPGATNSTLTLAKLQSGAVGSIRLVALNAEGSNTTSTASVSILPAPPLPTSAQPYAYAISANHPLVYWRFSETDTAGNGNLPLFDSSGNGFDALYGSNATTAATGPQNPAFPGFESDNTGVQLPGPTSLDRAYLISPDLNLNTNTVTITAWINPSANVITTAGLLMWRNGADAAGLGFGGASTNGMTELAYTWNTNSSLTWNWDSGLFPPLNNWSFVALTVTPNNATLYLDYVDVNTGETNLLKADNAIPHTAEAFSGGIIRIGDDTFDNFRVFPGSLDEVAVFAHSLSESQIQALFFTALGAPVASPLNFTWDGHQLTLSWTQGTLQEATSVSGPWTPNGNPSPVQVIPGDPQKFYRLKVQ